MKFRTMLAALAVTSMTCATAPIMAQDMEEEVRTTYAVTMVKLAPGSEARWNEIHETYINPARIAAGQSPEVVHFIMANSDYDLMVVREMPDGMATFDSHTPAARMAFVAELTTLAGGEEALATLTEEWNGLSEDTMTFFTHTHP